MRSTLPRFAGCVVFDGGYFDLSYHDDIRRAETMADDRFARVTVWLYPEIPEGEPRRTNVVARLTSQEPRSHEAPLRRHVACPVSIGLIAEILGVE